MHSFAKRAALLAAAVAVYASTALGAGPAKSTKKPAAKKKSTAKVMAGYKKAVRNWHATDPDTKQPVDASGRPELAIYSLNTRDKMVMRAATDHGGFSTRELDRLSYVLREPSTGNQHPIDPSLVDLVYRIQTHFHAPEIRVVSCYRTPKRSLSSNHGRGRAIDIIVPGATDEEVARFTREQGFVGVGIYPTSGFVHVDVRSRSYFWVDSSAPRHRNRERGILGDLAKKSDAAAVARGERGAPSLALASVDSWLHAQNQDADQASEEDEDVDPAQSPDTMQ